MHQKYMLSWGTAAWAWFLHRLQLVIALGSVYRALMADLTGAV